MAVSNVQRAIERVRPHLEEYQATPSSKENWGAPVNHSEMSTRYIVIDPILRSLGWDLSDPNECVVENVTEGGRPDYTFFDREGNGVMVIEAKRPQEDSRDIDHRAQVGRYGDVGSTNKVVVLTNGLYWDIWFNSGGVVVWENESDSRPLGLLWVKSDETAQRLSRHLSRDIYWSV